MQKIFNLYNIPRPVKNWYQDIKNKISKPKFIKIDFEKEDLQELDNIQFAVLKTCDGSMSVGYKTDRQIFELCLEIVDRIFRDCMVGNSNIDIPTKFEYVKNIHYFMEKYFKNYLDNKLL